MKINTHKLLLFTHFSQENGRAVSYDTLSALFPDLTSGGLRSFVHLLKKNNYVSAFMKDTKVNLRLTPYGEIMVKKNFPLFFPDEKHPSVQYHFLILRQAPQTDPH